MAKSALPSTFGAEFGGGGVVDHFPNGNRILMGYWVNMCNSFNAKDICNIEHIRNYARWGTTLCFARKSLKLNQQFSNCIMFTPSLQWNEHVGLFSIFYWIVRISCFSFLPFLMTSVDQSEKVKNIKTINIHKQTYSTRVEESDTTIIQYNSIKF